MTLPTGQITMAQVAAELGIGAGGLNLNDSRVRSLAGVPSGSISMANLQGKTNSYAYVSGITWLDYYEQRGTSGAYIYVATNNGAITSVVFANMTNWASTAYTPGYELLMQCSVAGAAQINISAFGSGGPVGHDIQIYVTFANGKAAYLNTGYRTWFNYEQTGG
ncbi:hypothetical protein ATN89_17415 [Comamonas thiooxydans]|uniref:hypothetical protein n=1 Tax=Comamonas thiooxydans TaxID=363952 RepID=UPI0007C52DE1|nr:hypothetical protein [Comamonas thiooxydans]OAD82861.1 hypothetical protein ATN89_17415 [Comamonas thiooxydans]